jgi:hypothetical protein
MIKEHPILFSTPMVQAILEGRKTQTRRVVKPQPYIDCKPSLVPRVLNHNENDWGKWYWETSEGETITKFCPHGEVGDLLWVRETHLFYSDENANNAILYMADPHAEEFSLGLFENKPKWKPSIFMPKAACRLWNEVINIKVERLQDISADDALEEGVNYWNVDREMLEGGEFVADYENYMWRDDENYEDYHFPTYSNPVDSFRSLWQSINGRESWDANPWVWAIEFKKVGKPA